MKKLIHLLFNPEEMSKEACAVCLVGIYALVALMFCWNL